MSQTARGGQGLPRRASNGLVPGRWLHAAHLAACLALVVAVLAGRDLVWWQLACGLAVAAASAARPDSPATALLLVGAVLVQLDHSTGPMVGGSLGWRTVALVLLVHLVHLLASLCAAIPIRAEVEPAALAPSGRRFVQVQVAVLVVFLLLLLLPAVPVSVPLMLVAGVVVVVLATLPLVLLNRGGGNGTGGRQ